MTRVELITQRTALMGLAEGLSKRELTPEEQGQLDGLLNQIRDLDSRLSALENADMAEDSNAANESDATATEPTKLRSFYGTPSYTTRSNAGGDLLGAWLRRGTPVARPDDAKLLTRSNANGNILTVREGLTSDAPKGSNVVGKTFYNAVVEELVHACRFLEFANVVRTNGGNVLQIPVDKDGLANEGQWLGQLAPDTIADPDVAQIEMAAYTATSKVILSSWELLADASIDVQNLFAKQLARRLAATCEKAYISGTSTGQPTGILHNAGSAGGLSVQETAATNAFSLDDFLSAIARIEPSYLSGDKVRAVLSPALLYKLRGLKDNHGRFLLADPVDGFNPTILGIKTEVSVNMPDDQICIGDFSQFWIRMAKEVELISLQEKYALQRATVWFGYLRTDSRWVTTRAAIVLKAKA